MLWGLLVLLVIINLRLFKEVLIPRYKLLRECNEKIDVGQEGTNGPLTDCSKSPTCHVILIEHL